MDQVNIAAHPHQSGEAAKGDRQSAAREPRYVEFIGFLAMCQAMAALAIDLLLPAFGDIRKAVGLAPDSTEVSWLITAFFLGSGFAQVATGILSDRFGRKRVMFGGLCVYLAACIATAFAPSLGWMIAARVVWGFGQSAPRVVSNAMVRDQFSSTRMAQTLSYMQSVFVIVPLVAPTFGTIIIATFGWRAAVITPALFAIILMMWLARFPETLPPERRSPPTAAALKDAFRSVLHVRRTLWPALGITLLLGVVNGYITLAELIFDETYNKKDAFPILFGVVAAVMGVAAFANARLVGRFGLRRMLRVTPTVHAAVALVFLATTLIGRGTPPLVVFAGCNAALLAAHALIAPNANSLALRPLGHVAGLAAGLVGTFTTVVAALIGSVIFGLHGSGTYAMSIAAAALSCGAFVVFRKALSLSGD